MEGLFFGAGRFILRIILLRLITDDRLGRANGKYRAFLTTDCDGYRANCHGLSFVAMSR